MANLQDPPSLHKEHKKAKLFAQHCANLSLPFPYLQSFLWPGGQCCVNGRDAVRKGSHCLRKGAVFIPCQGHHSSYKKHQTSTLFLSSRRQSGLEGLTTENKPTQNDIDNHGQIYVSSKKTQCDDQRKYRRSVILNPH